MKPESFITALTRAYPYSEPHQSSSSHFLQIPFNIIPSMPWSSKWPLSLRFPHQKDTTVYVVKALKFSGYYVTDVLP